MVSYLDAPLAELGKVQLQELRERLTQEGVVLDTLYASPILRAQQSAKILAEGGDIPIHAVEGLTEIFPNSVEGHTYDEIEERGGDIYAHPFSPDQETLDHLVERSKEVMKFIFADAKEKGYQSVGIVGHGDPLCALDWSIKHEDNPTSYPEMRDSYYPQKGQAKEYNIDFDLRLGGEGRIISTDSSKQTLESFRTSNLKEVE